MRFLIPLRPPPFLRAPLFHFPATISRELGMSVRVDLPCGARGGVPLPPAEGFALLPGDLDGAEDLQRYRAIEPFGRLHFISIVSARKEIVSTK